MIQTEQNIFQTLKDASIFEFLSHILIEQVQYLLNPRFLSCVSSRLGTIFWAVSGLNITMFRSFYINIYYYSVAHFPDFLLVIYTLVQFYIYLSTTWLVLSIILATDYYYYNRISSDPIQLARECPPLVCNFEIHFN